MNIRRSIVPLAAAVMIANIGHALAQGGFPAPLPGQAAPSGPSPFPPVNGAPAASAPVSSFPATGAAPITGSAFERPPAPPTQAGGQDCMKEFMPLREETERRGKMIKAAGDRTYLAAQGGEMLVVDEVADTGGEQKLPEFVRPMLGWGKKALRITVPASATEAQIAAVEDLCALAALQWRGK